MAGIYDEVEIEDMKYDIADMTFTFPCPCGDKFTISLEELHDGEDIATCPSCTLRIRVIFDSETLLSMEEAMSKAAAKTGEVKEDHKQSEEDKCPRDAKD